jgi:hypothetical protein
MSNRCGSIVLCALVIGTAGAASATDRPLQQTLQGRYAALQVAMAARDDKAVTALLTPTFTSINIAGQTENAAQMLGEIDTTPKDPSNVSKTTLLSIKRAGNTAIVQQRYDMKSSNVAANGMKRKVEVIAISTDTWVMSHGRWLMQKTQTDRFDYYLNGRRIVHQARP